jgi:hypothetical protein
MVTFGRKWHHSLIVLPSVSKYAFHTAWHIMLWVIYSINKDRFNGLHCNCFPSISTSTLCAKFIYCLCSLRIVHVCSLHSVEPLIIKHVISMTTTPKTGIKLKLLSVLEELYIISTLDTTECIPCTKRNSLNSCAFPCNSNREYSACSWAKKMWKQQNNGSKIVE